MMQCLPAAIVILLSSLQLYTHKSQITFQVLVCRGTVGKHYTSLHLNNCIVIIFRSTVVTGLTRCTDFLVIYKEGSVKRMEGNQRDIR